MSEVIHWSAGGTAQAELFNPPGDDRTFLLKYRSPFRSTIRQTYPCPAAAKTLAQADVPLDHAVKQLRGQEPLPPARGLPGQTGAGVVPAMIAGAAVEEQLRRAGEQLYDFFSIGAVNSELREGNLFLEIGTDDKLVGYPWELLHDGEEFLCLKHYMARYVNTTPTFPAKAAFAQDMLEFPKIRVLVISVPQPGHEQHLYPNLSGAEAETKELMTLLTGLPGIEMVLLANNNADVGSVRDALRKDFQIIHFCGHAYFDSADPSSSGIVLFDNDLPAKNLYALVRPSVILSFINACQTAAATGSRAAARNEWDAQFNTFGLARAFIEAGSYVLGSRWKLGDIAAEEFSRTFYTALLKERKPVGQAVLEARVACKKKVPTDLAWASYVYYGDPRIGFQHVR
jgi:CHAT domain-containing protein